VEKVVEIDSHIAAASSGLTADARTLVEHARVECQNHRFSYDEPLRIESLAQSVSDLMMSFGEGGEENKSKMSRPFGVSVLFTGWDARKNAPALVCCDPSGTYTMYKAHAIGNGSDGAVTQLEAKWSESMTLAEAEKLVAVILRQTMEEAVTVSNVEIVRITPGESYHTIEDAELSGLLEHAEAVATAEASD
jgi:20S proteasome subunit alpha 5